MKRKIEAAILIIVSTACGIILGLSLSNRNIIKRRFPLHGNVYYEIEEPNILRHVQGDKVTIYKEVEDANAYKKLEDTKYNSEIQ